MFASFGADFVRREWICKPVHWTGFPDVFSPRWETHCRIVARGIAREARGDPWCLGTFLDNELEWYGKRGHLVDEVFQLGAGQPAKKALYEWLLARYGSLRKINDRLGLQYASRETFLAAAWLPRASATLDEVREGFLAEIAERYFSVAAGAMHKADPEHIVLGCRFAGRAPQAALAAAGKYNDVFTFNMYPRVDFENAWRPDGAGGTVARVPRELMNMYRVVLRPMIITEWGFPALDSGLPCKHGAGMRVDTQEQKAACYRIFAHAMADLPFMVGYHYFMWADEPARGISATFPEDSNYGLVNEKDETYETLVKTAAAVNCVTVLPTAPSREPGPRGVGRRMGSGRGGGGVGSGVGGAQGGFQAHGRACGAVDLQAMFRVRGDPAIREQLAQSRHDVLLYLVTQKEVGQRARVATQDVEILAWPLAARQPCAVLLGQGRGPTSFLQQRQQARVMHDHGQPL
jgi:hypothetical protein